MSQAVPISARISQEDAEFISQLQIEGAKTPSDKLRMIISDARRRSLGRNDYPGALQSMQDLLLPNIRHIRESEYESNVHSELITIINQWFPDAVAYFVSSANKNMDLEQLKSMEEGMADRVLRLIGSVIRLRLTKSHGCYTASLLEEGIDSILELTEIIEKCVSEKEKSND